MPGNISDGLNCPERIYWRKAVQADSERFEWLAVLEATGTRRSTSHRDNLPESGSVSVSVSRRNDEGCLGELRINWKRNGDRARVSSNESLE